MALAKITLSPAEHQLVMNSDWILTKNGIIAKVQEMFGELGRAYDLLQQQYAVPSAVLGPRGGKIAKGEQYQGLPWVMLDNPRNFSATDTFAIRSFFWWGNFCSITLQLAGQFRHTYAPRVIRGLRETPADWLLYTGQDAWEHQLGNNYCVFTEYTGDAMDLPFFKISRKLPLENWESVAGFFTENYATLLGWVAEE